MMDRMSEVMADPGALEMAARMMKSMPAEQLHDLMSKVRPRTTETCGIVFLSSCSLINSFSL